MHSTWKRHYIIIVAVLLIVINVAAVCIIKALYPAKFKFTPEEKQEVDLRELDLCDDELIREVQAGGDYEIHHGSGTILNMSIGEVISGDQVGTSTITIMTKDDRYWLRAYEGSQITFVGSDEDAGILREGDAISFDYVIDEYNGDEVLISACVDRDPATLQQAFERERAQAEKEALAGNSDARSKAFYSLVAFDIVSAPTAAIMSLGIYLISKLPVRKGAKTLLVVTGSVIVFALWVYVLVFLSIPPEATVVGWFHSMPNAQLSLDGSSDELTYDPIEVEYTLEYTVFGQVYTTRCNRSFAYSPYKHYMSYETGDTVTIRYNPVFPDHVWADIWK